MKSWDGLVLVTGHYGSGKTNFAANLAVQQTRTGQTCTLADLDIVNPYFRSADFADLAEKEGFRLLLPAYTNTTLDIPALTAELDGAIHTTEHLLIDVGGDDAGARAVGRYAPSIRERGYQMVYVVNKYRPMIASPQQALTLLLEIEAVTRLQVTGIVNNSHLSKETTAQTIEQGYTYGVEVAELAGVPLLCTTAPRSLAVSLPETIPNLFLVDIFVTVPW